MNFEESNEFVEKMERNDKNKKTVLTIMAICAILIVVLFIMIAVIKNQDAKELKVIIDGQKVAITPTLLVQENEVNYINVKQLANLLKYSYQKGEYKNYTEDEKSCYLKTPYEIVSMSADSDTVTKYILNETGGSATNSTTSSDTTNTVSTDLIIVDEETGTQSLNISVESEHETQQIFAITEPIKYINDQLYIPFSELPRVFNVQLDISKSNRIVINSLTGLIPSVAQIATNLGYSKVSNTYENLTAIVDNMLIVGDGTNYGVVSLADGKEIISLKYEKIVYMQNTQEFLVTAENSVGIISKEGKTIIKPTEYEKISTLDELNKLYLVEKDHKYGVVNRDGDTIVYAEYDDIGIKEKEEFKNENIRNFSLLFDKCIPVESNGKMGLIDINENEKLKCIYDFGYIADSTSINDEDNTETDVDDEEDDETNTNSTTNSSVEVNDHDSVLIIPETEGIKGIVVNLDGLYGIYDAEAGRLIIPCACTKIYSKTKAGVTKYYYEYDGKVDELGNYLEEHGLKSINNNSQTQENDSEEVVEENTTEETSQE